MKNQLEELISKMHRRGVLYSEAVREFRKAFISAVLQESNGNQMKAARALGIHRYTLSRTASALGLDVRSFRPSSRRPPQSEQSEHLIPIPKRNSR